MKKVLLVLTLFLQYCLSFEEKIYTPPTRIKTLLVLPFIEENFEGKPFQEKKASPNFYLGFGLAHNVHQLANQSPEILSIPLSELAKDFSLEAFLKDEKEFLEFIKAQKLADYIVRGTFQVIQKDKLQITAKVYNLENLDYKKFKSSEIRFQEVSKSEEDVQYTNFIKNNLYPNILKFVLCNNVVRESCEPIQKEQLASFQLEETTEFSEFLAHSRGLYHFYESIHLAENSAQQLSEKNFSELYLRKAIHQSNVKGRTYKNAFQSLLLLERSTEQEALDLNLKLSRFPIFYNTSKDLLQPVLEKEEENNLRTIINQAIQFVGINPEYRIYITGNWSKEFDNQEYREKALRSTSLLEHLYGKQNGSSENSPYIFQDVLGEEDTTLIKLQRLSGGK
ncbi:MAG: hypothetical protein N3A69_04035 [Leptospiraceae bacterium]|nr:hypothetical protein [Leptospiraceae bacterium]